MRGLLKATAVLSTVGTLSTVAFFLGLLRPVERVAQSGYFSTQSYAFLLSVGLATGFLLSAAAVKATRKRNSPVTNAHDYVLVSPETENSLAQISNFKVHS